MSNRKKIDTTKLPVTVASVESENARRLALPKPEAELRTDRASRRSMRRKVTVMELLAQAQHQSHRHNHEAAPE